MSQILIPFIFAAAILAGPEAPEVVAQEGHVILVNLPDVFSDEDVRPHLTKGLTTTIAARVEIRQPGRRDAKTVGGARLAVRYDLWDEVFIVRLADASGVREVETLAGFDELVEWWTALELQVIAENAAGEARIELHVIPFSETEKNDAQRWFTRSLQRADRRDTQGLGDPTDDPAQTLSRTFHVLMATSIQRQALASHRFTVRVRAEP